MNTPSFFEPRFGQDFDHVRVHTDANAVESANALNAAAYAVGHDVVFGKGQNSPETRAGRKLMAHELAHNIQLATGSERQFRPERDGSQ
jgi:hypothetical protein